MPKSGLNQERVVQAAIDLIEEAGYRNFSMRALADRLQIRTASLYNHVDSMGALREAVGCCAVARLRQAQLDAIEGKRRDEAVIALARAYHDFGRTHVELYKVIMALPMENEALLHTVGGIVDPILDVFSQYGLTEQQQMHLQRVLRSILHGFISQEEAGYFRHLPVSTADSFDLAIRCFLAGLHEMEG